MKASELILKLKEMGGDKEVKINFYGYDYDADGGKEVTEDIEIQEEDDFIYIR